MTSAPRHAHLAAPRRGRGAAIALTALGVILVAALGAALLFGAGAVLLDDPEQVGLSSDDQGGAADGSDPPDTSIEPTPSRPTTTVRPTTTAPITTAPTTTAPPTTAPPTTQPLPPEPAAADGTLEAGESGPEVGALQARLVELGFWLGTPDGNYGSLTSQAVLAFQKANGLSRDGVAGPVTQAALATATRPAPRDPSAGNHIEIDLERQIMLLVAGGQTQWVLNTSTGTDSTPTPTGTFTIFREIDGVRNAPLGRLYRPKYFNGGIALHGSNSIPGGPASHGCTRLSDAAMDMIWATGAAPIGTTVVVY